MTSSRFELHKEYDPAEIERPVYDGWLTAGAFHARPDDRPPDRRYVIMMPLPNVTGALHMGHAMDNTMQDVLIRWHRMQGDNTLWMPGTDHAGIATQAVVEKRLKELEGLTRHDIGRDALVGRIWEWKDRYQARIIQQLQFVGCSCDWDRKRFTMDRVCARAVRHTFFRMFRDGLIFRGKRLVNWDPFLRTSISDDEVYHETVQGHFWHLRYPVLEPRPGEPEFVEVATTRPETMLGDTAVAVHPDPEGAWAAALAKARDEAAAAPERERAAAEEKVAELDRRRQDRLPGLLVLRDMARAGRLIQLPLQDRPIPLILDEWAKPELGSGCVKITPAHDPNDYDVWQRHRDRIDVVNILEPDGTLGPAAGAYAGLDRFEARRRVVDDLSALGLLGAVEDREIEIGHSDRSKTPIEPYLSDQWYVRMGDVADGVVMGAGTPRAYRAAGLVQAAMDAIRTGRVVFHPDRFARTCLDWLGEKRDWPISRQLWWGHRIPVFSRRVDASDLAALLDSDGLRELRRRPDQVCLRLIAPDGEQSVVLRPGDPLPDWGGSTRLDICLLEDNPAGLAALTEAGFTQDEDVLDTWFSSAIWPHSTLGWPDPATADTEGGAPLGAEGDQADCLSYYYPGSCLVTARDIITLWVARMIVTGLYNLGDIPFRDVFIHANILDGTGRRMSKSAGNGIDPVHIIEQYGADAMRYVLCDMQTGNQDIRLPVTAICPACQVHLDLAQLRHGRSVFTYLCGACGVEFDVLGTMPDLPAARLVSDRFIDGRKFCNKLWNTARFALGHLGSHTTPAAPLGPLALEDRWILSRLDAAITGVTRGLAEYSPSQALEVVRDFMWGSLCDWYLELLKPRLQTAGAADAAVARQVLAHVLDTTLRLLHPFVPFITEHIHGRLAGLVPDRGLPGLRPGHPDRQLIHAPWPRPEPSLYAPAFEHAFAIQQALTGAVREARGARGVHPGRLLTITVRPPVDQAGEYRSGSHVLHHLGRAAEVRVDPEATRPAGAVSLVVGAAQIFLHDLIDDATERTRLTAERQRLQGEIAICQRKLDNRGFVDRAPAEVVAEQRTRLERYQAQAQAVEAELARLGD